MTITTAPYGSWTSPLSPEAMTQSRPRLDEVTSSDGVVYWLEGRAEAQGRTTLVRRTTDGTVEDVTPDGVDVRSRVHEYGGGAYTVHGETIYFVGNRDQRIYRMTFGATPEPIVAESEPAGSTRFADLHVLPGGSTMACVRERHGVPGTDEAVNDLVTLPVDGSAPPTVIAEGRDFFSAPRANAGGTQLAWICWDHPNLPWDGTELWLADLAPDGTVSAPRQIAGGPSESICEPRFGPNGVLHFVSDRTGWWNLYRFVDGHVRALAPDAREYSFPAWVFGQSSYVFLSDGRIIAAAFTSGFNADLCVIHPDGTQRPLRSPCVEHRNLAMCDDGVAFLGGREDDVAQIVLLDADLVSFDVLRRAGETPAPGHVSRPQPITFPSGDGLHAHAWFYPPHNEAFRGPDGERPPLMVILHGGPTGARGSGYQPMVQFFTTRGFAVADVNYRGSTGYGRPYRESLYGNSGIAEPDDCVHVARFLAEQGLVDGERLGIRGGSAGGYIVLCSVTFHDVFTAGVSYFGIADVEALAKHTHKFESRYVDRLIGPYPAEIERYHERSPIHHVERISCPLLILQGAQDRVVPQDQADSIVAALDSGGTPHAYLLFENEAHGFRSSEAQRQSYEAELSFFGQVFGFTPDIAGASLEVRHLGQDATG